MSSDSVTVDFEKPLEEWSDEEKIALIKDEAAKDTTLGAFLREHYPSFAPDEVPSS